MTPEYILRKSLCREPHCGASTEREAQIRQGLSAIEEMTWANAYAERGYSDPAKAILFANWNYFPRGVDSLLENYGYAIEWSDEWDTCGNCNRAVRTQADSYGWQPSYVMENDCELTCVDCLKRSPESYLESLEDSPSQTLNIQGINPADYGYVRLEAGFESGMHPGQNDNPREIFKRLRANGHDRILFRVSDVRQFDMEFEAWAYQGDE